MTGKKLTTEHKQCIKNANSGGKYVYKDNIVKHIKLNELDYYLAQG